jgi:hypothetical protein
MRAILAFTALLTLPACVENKPVSEMTYTEQRALAEEISQSCRDQGVKDGTREMDRCFEIETDREIAKREKAAEDLRLFGSALGAGMQSYGRSMAQSSYRQPVNCTSNMIGAYTYTNCY